MRVFHNYNDFSGPAKSIVTVGTFDGVHQGHRKLIERLRQSAQDANAESVILTFFPHPRMVLFPNDNDLRLLNTIEEKTALLREAGIDNLIIHPFTKEFSRLSATEFIRDVLVKKMHLAKIVIGYNHQFGRNREGTFEQLTEMAPLYQFEVEEIPEQDVNQIAVSSTKIREALNMGDAVKANELLGYRYALQGTVIHGDAIGRTLGFPTANMAIADEYKLIPGDGIYAAYVHVEGQRHRGLLYIGKRPVLGSHRLSIEANILDFDRDIYGQNIRVELVEKIRGDMQLPSLELLRQQMHKDKEVALGIFSKNEQ